MEKLNEVIKRWQPNRAAKFVLSQVYWTTHLEAEEPQSEYIPPEQVEVRHNWRDDINWVVPDVSGKDI